MSKRSKKIQEIHYAIPKKETVFFFNLQYQVRTNIAECPLGFFSFCFLRPLKTPCEVQQLETLVRERGRDSDTLKDVVDALKVFDSDNDGKISVEDFKYVMSNMGERMSESEINEIIQDTELINGKFIAVEEFGKMIMNRI